MLLPATYLACNLYIDNNNNNSSHVVDQNIVTAV
jgi:hypothetical protein